MLTSPGSRISREAASEMVAPGVFRRGAPGLCVVKVAKDLRILRRNIRPGRDYTS